MLIVILVMFGTLSGIYLSEIIDNPISIILPFILSTIGLIAAILLIIKLSKIINKK